MNKKQYKYQLQGDLGIDYQDAGPWRSYDVEGAGDTVEEFLENLQITEVDQDGGEIVTYGFDDAPGEVEKVVLGFIERVSR